MYTLLFVDEGANLVNHEGLALTNRDDVPITKRISNSDSHLLCICVDMSLLRTATFLYLVFIFLAQWRQLQRFLRISQRSLMYSHSPSAKFFSKKFEDIRDETSNATRPDIHHRSPVTLDFIDTSHQGGG